MANSVESLRDSMRQTILAMPRRAGTEAVNFALDNFRRRGFQGYTFQPWRRLKNGKDATLIRKGHGRRSIRVMRTETYAVAVGSNLKYMKAHNEGFRGTVQVPAHTRMLSKKMKVGSGKFNKSGSQRMKTVTQKVGEIRVKAHNRRMNLPKRQFLGDSPILQNRIKRIFAAMILQAAKQ